MDFLKSLPTRDDAIMIEEEDDRRNRAKQKRVIPIEEEEEEEEPRHKRAKTTSLGLNLQDDYFEIEEIKQRPLPREDGRQWSFMERTEVEEKKRPYGKEYLREQAERQKLLSNNKDYRFADELAGALRKDLVDILEPEDMARLTAERERERMETEIELKRTRVDMDKKYELLQKLKVMLREEEAKSNTLKNAQIPYDLRMLSKYLVDNTSLTSTTPVARNYGFIDLLAFYKTYSDGEWRTERDKLVTMTEEDMSTRDEAWLDLFFYVFVYYRDFLDNESTDSLTVSLIQKLTYALDTITTPMSSVKKEEAEEEEDNVYERQLDALGLDEPNPLKLLRRLAEDDLVKSGVNWPLYKRRHTETINMNYFERMNISRRLEGQMAKMGADVRYGETQPLYLRKVLAYLYGTAQEREQSLIGKEGLNLFRDEEEDAGGNPLEISALIRIQFPGYKEEKQLREIELLLRSHFLWLFFEETSWTDITTLLMTEQAIIMESIRRVMSEIRPILESTLTLYKALMWHYMMRIILLMTTSGVIELAPDLQTLILMNGGGGDDDTIMDVKKDAALFDALNLRLANVNLRDLIRDDVFYDYFYGEKQQQQQQPIVGEPALILHTLFRVYEAYIGESTNTNRENVKRLETAIQNAAKKIIEVVGDESYSLGNNNSGYRQRKSFTTLPENSGFVKMRAEILYLLRQSYHYVMDYCPSLRELPLEAFQSDSAYETGLATDFIGVVAVMAADREFSFPDGYRSGKQFTKIKQDKQGMMMRMRRYCWRGGNGRPYVIIKDRDGDMGTRPFFAPSRSMLMF